MIAKILFSHGMYVTLNNNQAPKIVVTIMGLVGMLATISESALSISCCIGFLKKLSKGLSVNFAVLVYDIITKHNGQRFIVIILLRLVKVGMLTAVISAPTGPAAQSFNCKSRSHVPFHAAQPLTRPTDIHSWLFGLEIAALTSFSFEATKRMVNEHGMQSKRNSGRTTSEASHTASNTGVKSNVSVAPSPRPIKSSEL
ncbi:hypothetical protein BC831DRAFT_469484 [Entophlyctis helioformis]|nr:hypothetical protein BC831DRAFT_469484 [Entophlyctis helioformis]